VSKHDNEWDEVIGELQSMSVDELEAFVPVVEALARAKSTGFLFDEYVTLQ
jgi:hypothetical protein